MARSRTYNHLGQTYICVPVTFSDLPGNRWDNGNSVFYRVYAETSPEPEKESRPVAIGYIEGVDGAGKRGGNYRYFYWCRLEDGKDVNWNDRLSYAVAENAPSAYADYLKKQEAETLIGNILASTEKRN